MTAPVITNINPNSNPPSTIPPNTANNAIVIDGYFDNTCQVWFNGSGVSITSLTPNQITVTYNSGAGPANITVLVTGVDGSSAPATLAVSANGGRAHRAAAAAVTPSIGILSSIKYRNTPFQTWLQFGLGMLSSPYNFVIQDGLGYQPGPLATQAAALSNANPAVIITFGGNVVASAMAQNNPNNVAFFSVIGNLTVDLSAARYLSGGVNLDTVGRNADRFNHLTNNLNIPSSEIAFLSNPGSAMYLTEQAQWAALNPGGAFYQFNPLSLVPPITTVQQGFDSVFQAFARNGGASVMLISADPAFQDNKDALIASANKANKMVCYPLQTYNNNSGTLPASGRFTMHGPKLGRACFLLGHDVVSFLVTNARMPLRVPPMLVNAGNDVS
jgi:hypothetical protein